MTGFSALVCAVIDCRSGGVCEVCGAHRAVERHHRRPRGAGGSRREDTNSAANALHLCTYCHHLIEHNRALAYLVGWLLPQTQSPERERVLRRGDFVLLADDGSVQPHEGWAAA
ncbi:hypothetical protein [Mycolicibacterium sphagni]|uniref:HNH endonuclease n=1 Tax=Mycolicibacterium sphagni TaxID=1786 RepID=A0A255DCJ5_9MYCO|nr:hypothetical protein [Mycolicibacterium sphagni]OYN76830.1 hypothetical protein CG716_20160 [Mycolicibacterium sphagni]